MLADLVEIPEEPGAKGAERMAQAKHHLICGAPHESSSRVREREG